MKASKEKFGLNKSDNLWIWLLAITTFLIAAASLIFKQNFVTTIPLYVSLFIMLLQSNANRYAALVGGINSLIYALVYLNMGLYSTILNCLLVSFPIQIATFIRWNRRKYNHSTIFQKMNARQRILTLLALLISCALVYFTMRKLGGSYAFFDTLISILGTLVSILTLLSFIEYSYLALLTGLINILLWVTVSMDDPRQITFVLYTVYAYICIVKQFILVRRLYKEQQLKNCPEVK